MSISDILSGLGGGINTVANGLGGALYPTDPNTAQYVDPASAAAARNNALIQLGLGIMRAPYSMTGVGGGLLDAYQNSQQGYQNAMDNAFKHTLIKRQLDQAAEDRAFQQQERQIQLKQGELGLKQAERADRTAEATTAQRLLNGLQNAADPNAYVNNIAQYDPGVRDMLQSRSIPLPYNGPMANPGNMDQFKQQLSAVAAEAPPPTPIKLEAGAELIDPLTKQVLASAAPKGDLSIEKGVSIGNGQVQDVTVDHRTGQIKSISPPYAAPRAQFGDQQGALLAALAAQGVALPAGLRSKEQQMATLSGLLQKYPDKSPDDIASLIKNGQIDFSGAKKAGMDFTTGKAGNTVRSLNVAVQHLDTLSGIADALGNGNLPLLNKAANFWKSQTGQPAPVTFDAAKKIVADEVVKAIVGSGGGVADREEAARTINAAQSPAQLKQVIDTYKQLMGGQLEGLRHQYEQSTGKTDFDRFLMEGTKAQLEGNKSTKGTVSAATLSGYAQKHGISESDARQFLTSQGYQVQ